jgi:hypothetical protein
MADLKVDIDQLDLLRIQLDKALDVINEDSDIARELGDAVGHEQLRYMLEIFSDSWKKHRFDIRDNLLWLKDSVDKIGQSFEDTDVELATALTTPPPSATNSTTTNSGPVSV